LIRKTSLEGVYARGNIVPEAVVEMIWGCVAAAAVSDYLKAK